MIGSYPLVFALCASFMLWMTTGFNSTVLPVVGTLTVAPNVVMSFFWLIAPFLIDYDKNTSTLLCTQHFIFALYDALLWITVATFASFFPDSYQGKPFFTVFFFVSFAKICVYRAILKNALRVLLV